MKFRMIQSNDHGLVTQAGDRTYARRKPAKGEEAIELATLFIWVRKPERYLARCWTRWTRETIGSDFVYEVTRFRDLIDLEGDTRFHQWCSQELRAQLWELERPQVEAWGLPCPLPEEVYEADRHRTAIYLQRRKERVTRQTPSMTQEETTRLAVTYQQRDHLNREAGFIKYHVDHIIPLAAGGLHHPDNVRVVTAHENVRKGARLHPVI